MASPYDTYETSKDLESVSGVKLQYDGYSITIHRAGGTNAKYPKVIAAKLKPYRYQQQQGTMDEDIAKRLLAEAYSEAVIIGWEGLTDKEGKSIAFNKENCTKLLLDLPDLFANIQDAAGNFATFKAEQEAVEEKN